MVQLLQLKSALVLAPITFICRPGVANIMSRLYPYSSIGNIVTLTAGCGADKVSTAGVLLLQQHGTCGIWDMANAASTEAKSTIK